MELGVESSSPSNNKGGESSHDQISGQRSSPIITAEPSNHTFMPSSSSEAHDTYKILGVKGRDRVEKKNTTKPTYITSRLLSLRSKFQTKVKRAVWKWHGKLIPILHWQDWVETRFFSHCLTKSKGSPALPPPPPPPPPPKELFVNLRVLWNKVISSLDPTSPVYEGKVISNPNVDKSNRDGNDEATDTIPTTSSVSRLPNKSDWWSYRLLPPTTRWILAIIPSFLFPRWFHANIELRTAYLNRAVDHMIDRRMRIWEEEAKQEDYLLQQRKEQHHPKMMIRETPRPNKIRLVILGAGYDTRSVRLLQQGRVDQVWEFDLPPVMESKRWLLNRRGLWNAPIPFHQWEQGKPLKNDTLKNDQSSSGTTHENNNSDITSTTASIQETKGMKVADLQCIGLDLNQPDNFRLAMEYLVQENTDATSDDSSLGANEWYTIVISEALFLYLEPDIPAQLLTICQNLFSSENRRIQKGGETGSTSHSQSPPHSESLAFCFADRLLEVPLEQSHDENAIQQWFDKIGWTLVDWLPKEGATRQMGISRPI
ncbi:unnamed protein product [Cylindrotheca closterium]|uniref:Uncharacterized protein n=1 Tax=Cylindrotheca closterium TaxID=2856 RepID=A0AAD2FFE2_9STRA|nr:unnamed protein product [Cylindrotheca closterium]